MFDWNRFISDLQGPLTTVLLGILVAAGGLATRWLNSKAREQEARTEDAKWESAAKKAEVVVGSLNQKNHLGPNAKKQEALNILGRLTPGDIKTEMLDHVIEQTVAKAKAEEANPAQKLEVEAKVEQE